MVLNKLKIIVKKFHTGFIKNPFIIKVYNKTPENLLFTNKKACLQVSAYE